MRSAQCASAPSHPFHVMPSRITRNSYRPRASYRTMVASEATSALAALSQLDSMSPSAEKLTRMDNKPNFSREVKLQWAGSRETTSTSGRGGTFFLTSLFIELIDAIQGGIGLGVSVAYSSERILGVATAARQGKLRRERRKKDRNRATTSGLQNFE